MTLWKDVAVPLEFFSQIWLPESLPRFFKTLSETLTVVHLSWILVVDLKLVQMLMGSTNCLCIVFVPSTSHPVIFYRAPSASCCCSPTHKKTPEPSQCVMANDVFTLRFSRCLRAILVWMGPSIGK